MYIIYLALVSSCDDFLSDSPDNRTTLETPKKVSQLLTNAYSGAQHALFTETMTDNVDDKGPAARGDYIIPKKAYKWEDIEVTSSDSPNYYWEKGYEAIAHANQALESIRTLGGGAVLDPMKGEALLARAYAHFMLLNMFSPHYDAKTAATALGVPYVISPEKNAIRQYQRSTIQQVYDAIEKDMNAGLPLVREGYKKPKFHFTPAVAHAFAARFYLWKGGSSPVHWNKVVKHANKVLGSGAPSASLIRDYNSAAYQKLSTTEKVIAHSSSSDPSNLLITWAYSIIDRQQVSSRYGITKRGFIGGKEAELFGSGHPLGKAWGYTIAGGNDYYRNALKFYEYQRITDPVAGTGPPHAAIIHLTTDEVLLNRAEAYAMLGEFENASRDLTVFLSRKTTGFDASTDRIDVVPMQKKYPRVADEYTPYYPLTDDQAAFVKGISEMKRREFVHEGMRWFDIKRFHLMVKHPVVDADTLVLQKKDLRKALQIPQYVQVWGIKPNPR